jgi:bacteriorhodopsin
VVSHDNIHIPKESWPHWTWYAIEFFIALAIAMVIAFKTTDSIEGLAPDLQNWVFYGIVTLVFLVWYIVIRGLILKKPIFQNRN